MRILVTGATGFIGTALVPALKSRGHEVLAAGRNDPAENALIGCDAVVHLANIAHATAPKDVLWRVNVDGTRRLAQRASAAKIRRFVYLSSIKASGNETRDRPFDGTEFPAPQDEYGRSKLAAEHALGKVAAHSRMETVVLRPPLVYGPHVRANFLALMRAIDSGWPLPFASIQNRRSLVYLENLTDAIAVCLLHAKAAGRTYVISDGAALSTPALCRALAQAMSRSAHLFRFPVSLLEAIPRLKPLCSELVLDDATFRGETGWAPRFSSEEGIQATARWYLDG